MKTIAVIFLMLVLSLQGCGPSVTRTDVASPKAGGVEITPVADKDQAAKSAGKEEQAPAGSPGGADLEDALDDMLVTRDDVKGITWYEDGNAASRHYLNLYIENKDGQPPVLRIELRYIGDQWLFLESFTVMADGKKFNIYPAALKREALGWGMVLEMDDRPVTDETRDMVKAVIGSDEAMIRYNGRTAFSDKAITAEEKAALKKVINAYNALGGSF